MVYYYKKRVNGLIERYRNHYFPPFRIKDRTDFEGLPLNTPDKVSHHISNLLDSETPCMISRFGSTELYCSVYFGKGGHPLWFLRKIFPFWVPKESRNQMIVCTGFFPDDTRLYCDFADMLIDSAKEVDLLGSWVRIENKVDACMKYERCPLLYLEPYWSSTPWTRSLIGKKILVVHPFAETIKEQYEKRCCLFDNTDVLPDFLSLTVIKSVQSIGGNDHGFSTWFDALSYMEKQIDAVDYDIALIGCGAYGMPLAAHCKKTGKKAVHLGGALQLLFGIKGHRWEEEGYGNDWGFDYRPLINNPYWVRAKLHETPAAASKVENACYW